MAYPCSWALPLVAIALSAAGSLAPQGARSRTLAYVLGFTVAFLIVHLYGTGLSQALAGRQPAIALAEALLLAFEGLFLLGVQSVWGRIRGRSPGNLPESDLLTAAVLGAGMAFAAPLCLSSAALMSAARLGSAGQAPAAFLITLTVALGSDVAVLAISHLAYLGLRRLRKTPWISRAAGAALLVFAVLIAFGRLG